MEERRWVDFIPAYLGWAIVAALGVWLLMISRTSFLGIMSATYIDDSIWRAWRARFFDKVYFVVAGILWCVFVVIAEAYIRKGAGHHDLWQRIAKFLGIELLLIFAADFILLVLQGFTAGAWQRWLIVIGELALGVAASVFGRRSAKKTKA